MHRPTRTRRLSIAAMASLLAFVMVAGAAARSLWVCDGWTYGGNQAIGFYGGRVIYTQVLPNLQSGHFSSTSTPIDRTFRDAVWGFSAERKAFPAPIKVNPRGQVSFISVTVPIWPLLLLLLIAPARWLIARSASAPAFPVVTRQP